jgi:hypothetical protein
VENGRRQGGNLTIDTGRKLAEALGVTLDWLSGVSYDDEQQGEVWPPGTDDACRLTAPASQMHQEIASAVL